MTAPRSAEYIIEMAEELDLRNREGRRGSRGGRSKTGRGGKGGGPGGSGGGEMNREVAISKALSKLLRHAAVDVGLRLDPEGFARVDQVVSAPLRIKSWQGVVRTAKVDITCFLPVRSAGASTDFV